MASADKKSVTVVGGGFSAFTAAFFLHKAGFKVAIRNPSYQWGGVLQTKGTPYGLVETAANALISDQLVEAVADEIGVELLDTNFSARKKYIYNNGFKRWPVSLLGNLSFIPFLFKLNLWKNGLKAKPKESLQDWGNRHIGKANSKLLLSTAIQGIYAASAAELNAELIVKSLFFSEKPLKGDFKGSVAPRWGMEDWSKKFLEYFEKNNVVCTKGSRLEHKPKGLTVLATSLKGAKNFLGSWGDNRAFLLNKISLVDMLSVTVFIKPSKTSQKGFGCLFPRGQGVVASGVLFNDCIFSGRTSQGLRSETWIFSSRLVGSRRDIMDMEEEEIIDIIKKDRHKVGLGQDEFVSYAVNKWPEAIPLYSNQLSSVLSALPLCHDQVYLHGNYLGDLGLAKILFRSKLLAKNMKDDFIPGAIQ